MLLFSNFKRLIQTASLTFELSRSPNKNDQLFKTKTHEKKRKKRKNWKNLANLGNWANWANLGRRHGGGGTNGGLRSPSRSRKAWSHEADRPSGHGDSLWGSGTLFRQPEQRTDSRFPSSCPKCNRWLGGVWIRSSIRCASYVHEIPDSLNLGSTGRLTANNLDNILYRLYPKYVRIRKFLSYNAKTSPPHGGPISAK